MMGGWGGMMGGFGGFPLLWLLIIVGVVLLVIYLPNWREGGNRWSSTDRWRGQDPAMEILKRRYAMGEIERDEYEEKRKTLL